MKRPPLLGRSLVRGLSPFAGEKAARLVPRAQISGPVPWVLAIMITLTVLAAAGGLALNNLADTARAELSGGITVQIVEADKQLQARQTAQALELLTADPAHLEIRQRREEILKRLYQGGVALQAHQLEVSAAPKQKADPCDGFGIATLGHGLEDPVWPGSG